MNIINALNFKCCAERKRKERKKKTNQGSSHGALSESLSNLDDCGECDVTVVLDVLLFLLVSDGLVECLDDE